MNIIDDFNSIKGIKKYFKISYFTIAREYLSGKNKPIKVSKK
ncbi:MAG: hypothetical protein ACP5RS_05350 [Thermoplasmata archaeon]